MNGTIRQVRNLGDDGEWVYTSHFFVDGVEVTEDEFRKAFPDQMGCPNVSSWKTPLKSNALWVHPSTIPQAIEAARKKGVDVTFDDQGRAELRDRNHRKEYCEKVRGCFDMDGGYSDPQSKGPVHG